MRKSLGMAALAAMVVLSQPAAAATIINGAATNGSFLTVATLQAGDDLRNNQDYSSAKRAYALYESGAPGGDQTLLLHYDRSGGALSFGRVSGVFQIALEANEFLDGVLTSSLGLLATDPDNGVTYQRSFANPIQSGITLLRGLEPNGLPLVGDYINIVEENPHLYTISYDFQNNGATQDQARFFISSVVPEPAAWALMIGGFGLAGVALRRRRGAFATA